jgi:carboxyl-terminal processing protease
MNGRTGGRCIEIFQSSISSCRRIIPEVLETIKKLNAVTGCLPSGGLFKAVFQRGCQAVHGVAGGLFVLILSASPAFAEADAQDPTLRALTEAIEQVKSRYVGSVDGQKLVADAIRGMLQGLDPYSDYLDADAYRELKQDNGGRFGGLGMEVGMDAGGVRVMSAYEDAPAFQAGLRPGDRITRMNDISVAGLTLEQAIRRARGEPDTSIALTVFHPGDDAPHEVTVKRAIIQSRSVKFAVLGSGYGYAKISHFDQRTPESLLAALAQMTQSAGTLKGVLLDLRDNPGGLLKSAVGVSSIFLPDDSLVVYTEAAAAESRMRLQTSEKLYLRNGSTEAVMQLPYLKTLPLVVLVNSGSASAAEVLAGALQDQHRATIAGTQTFGKASVQVLVPLADGAALKLTTAHYLTPAGQRIQGKGVTPDRIIEGPRSATVIAASAAVLEENGGDAALCSTADSLRAAAATGQPGAGDDCQLVRALDLLRHMPVIARN